MPPKNADVAPYLYMAAGFLVFGIIDLLVQSLVRNEVSAIIVLLYRQVLTVPVAPLAKYFGYLDDDLMGPKEDRLALAMRGVFGFGGMLTFYSSLGYISLADAITIWQLMPFAVSVMGFYWLKEPIARFEIGCGLVAFAGCVLVIQPTFLFTAEQSITAHDRMIGSALVLGTVILDAATKIAVRSVGTNVHPLISIHWMASVILIGSGIIGLAVPSMAKGVTAFSWLNAVMITLIAVGGFLAQYFYTMALQQKKAGRVTLMCFIAVPWAMCLTWLVYGIVMSALALFGSAIILSCAVATAFTKEVGDHERSESTAVADEDVAMLDAQAR